MGEPPPQHQHQHHWSWRGAGRRKSFVITCSPGVRAQEEYVGAAGTEVADDGGRRRAATGQGTRQWPEGNGVEQAREGPAERRGGRAETGGAELQGGGGGVTCDGAVQSLGFGAAQSEATRTAHNVITSCD